MIKNHFPLYLLQTEYKDRYFMPSMSLFWESISTGSTVLKVSASINFKLTIGELNDHWNLYLKIFGEMSFAKTNLGIDIYSAVTDRI